MEDEGGGAVVTAISTWLSGIPKNVMASIEYNINHQLGSAKLLCEYRLGI